MKKAGNIISSLVVTLLAVSPSRASVEVVRPQNSYQKVRIVIVLGGRPRKDAKVDVYRYSLGQGEDSKPVISLVSDDDGKVLTSALPPGKYHLVAAGEHNLRADLYLDIPRKSGNEISSFSMELFESPYPTMDQKWAAADELPIKDRVGAFNGTVYDPTGAVVPGVAIEVVTRGTKGKQQVTQVTSEYDGKFSAQLPEGTYIALFSMPGFRIVFTPFEVTKQSSGQLRVVLQLGTASQTVIVSGGEKSSGAQFSHKEQL